MAGVLNRSSATITKVPCPAGHGANGSVRKADCKRRSSAGRGTHKVGHGGRLSDVHICRTSQGVRSSRTVDRQTHAVTARSRVEVAGVLRCRSKAIAKVPGPSIHRACGGIAEDHVQGGDPTQGGASKVSGGRRKRAAEGEVVHIAKGGLDAIHGVAHLRGQGKDCRGSCGREQHGQINRDVRHGGHGEAVALRGLRRRRSRIRVIDIDRGRAIGHIDAHPIIEVGVSGFIAHEGRIEGQLGLVGAHVKDGGNSGAPHRCVACTAWVRRAGRPIGAISRKFKPVNSVRGQATIAGGTACGKNQVSDPGVHGPRSRWSSPCGLGLETAVTDFCRRGIIHRDVVRANHQVRAARAGHGQADGVRPQPRVNVTRVLQR